jgi:hypothetical protein
MSSVSNEEFISGAVTGNFDEEWVTVILDNKTKARVKRSVLSEYEVPIKQGERFHLVEISDPQNLNYSQNALRKR